MKPLLPLFPVLVLASWIPACDRQPGGGDAQRQADERRIAELRDLETKAAQRDADGAAAQNAADRQAIADERAALERDKAGLDAAQRKAAEQRIAALERKQREGDAARRAAAERADETRRADGAAQTQSGQKLDFFYHELDPYGDWVELAKYGYVWQPNEARDPSWRPYTDGHWAWTDYGWTWVSNEKFGWAVYHYGRWIRVQRAGWVWVPGSEWAPAWVSWRHNPQYLGWAPLPPEAHSASGFTGAVDSSYDIGPSSYSFVPVAELAGTTYVGRVVEPERSVRLVSETTNITNVTYRNVQNTTVVYNAGPSVEAIEAQTHAPLPRLTVERVANPAAAGPAGQSGNVLRLAAPVIAAAARAVTAPQKVREHLGAAAVDHGWGAGSPPTAAEAKPKPTATAPLAPAAGAKPAENAAAQAAMNQQAEERRAAALEKRSEEAAAKKQADSLHAADLQTQAAEAAARKEQAAEARRAAEEKKRLEAAAHPPQPPAPETSSAPLAPRPKPPLREAPARESAEPPAPHPAAPAKASPHATPHPAAAKPASAGKPPLPTPPVPESLR